MCCGWWWTLLEFLPCQLNRNFTKKQEKFKFSAAKSFESKPLLRFLIKIFNLFNSVITCDSNTTLMLDKNCQAIKYAKCSGIGKQNKYLIFIKKKMIKTHGLEWELKHSPVSGLMSTWYTRHNEGFYTEYHYISPLTFSSRF